LAIVTGQLRPTFSFIDRNVKSSQYCTVLHP